jgi:aminoglycoside N3'-acetyltransferase
MTSNYYNLDDIIQSLKNAGLEEGNSAYFSTSLGLLGIAEDVSSQEELNALFFKAIKQVLGPNGTLIVPTYSYTFGPSTKANPSVFDPQTTPAEIGPFPNFILKQPGVVRALEPMMSMAALGPNSEKLFKNLPHTSYGADSTYERMLSISNMKCVSIGLGPNWTPFIHYADWLARVPHRYDKLFYGGIKNYQSDIEYLYWIYSVPARIEQSYADAHSIGKKAAERGIWQFSPLGRARVYVGDYRQYFEFVMSELHSNPWSLARGPACNVLEEDQKKFVVDDINFKDINGIKQLNQLVSHCCFNQYYNQINSFVDSLCRIYSLEHNVFLSGEKAFDWLVPEAWHLNQLTTDLSKNSIKDKSMPIVIPHSKTFKGDGQDLPLYLQQPYQMYSKSFLDRECAIHIQGSSINDIDHEIEISTEFAFGHWKAAHKLVNGQTSNEIFLCCYLEQSWLPNDNLYLIQTILQTIDKLKAAKPWLSYRLMILPQTFGYACQLTRLNIDKCIGALHFVSNHISNDFSFHFIDQPISDFKTKLMSIFKRNQIKEINQKDLFFDPVATGQHPLAEQRLKDLKFSNATIMINNQLLSTSVANEHNELAEKLLGLLSGLDELMIN